ncbi:MAG: CvpA family protein [Dehalococcoidia bacterium]
MNWFDLLVGGILGWSAFSSLRRGLIREFVGFVAMLVGAIAAGRYYDDLSSNFAFVTDNEAARNLIAATAIFSGISVIGAVASQMLKTVASVLMLGPLDHLGGAVFGLAKGLLFVELFIVLGAQFPAFEQLTSGVNGSLLAPYLLSAAPFVERLLPAEFHDAISQVEAGIRGAVPSIPAP